MLLDCLLTAAHVNLYVYVCVTWFSWQSREILMLIYLIIFDNHKFSFRKADLHLTAWQFFFPGLCYVFHHILHDSMCSIYTCKFSGKLFFTWCLVLNITKDNSVLPPWALNLLVPDLLPCHAISFIRGMKQVYVQCESRGEIQIPVCLYPVAEIPEKGKENEALKGEFWSL